MVFLVRTTGVISGAGERNIFLFFFFLLMFAFVKKKKKKTQIFFINCICLIIITTRNFNEGDPGSIPGSGRSAEEGISYPLQYSWASLVAQVVKNLPAMRET